MLNFLVLFFVLGALTGCEAEEKAQALLAKPAITQVGEFEGCKVSFVNRGYESTSFYMAKCKGEAATITQNSTHMQGKVRVSDRTTTIVESTESLKEELLEQQKKVEQIQAELKVKQDALSKLTDKEKDALGLVPAKQ